MDDDEVDQEDDSSADLLMCPSCRRAVHEDTQQCPHCGDWIIPIDPAGRSRRLLWTVVVVLLVLAFAWWTVR